MKLENKLLKIETKLREAAEARNITPPVRQALDHSAGRLYKADNAGNDHAIN